MPLHVTMIIFWKEVVTGNELLWKSNFQAWALRIVYYTSIKITEDGLDFYFSFLFLFLFYFPFSIYFLFLELGLGLSDKDHAVTWSQVT